MLPKITGEFRCVADPELRFASSGMAICSVRIVANSRKKVGEEWQDDKVVWLRATAFKRQAENMAESLVKGALVLVSGSLQTEEYETKEGEKRQTYTVLVDTIGPSLANKAARILDAPSSGGGGGQQQQSGGDHWSSTAGDEPPF